MFRVKSFKVGQDCIQNTWVSFKGEQQRFKVGVNTPWSSQQPNNNTTHTWQYPYMAISIHGNVHTWQYPYMVMSIHGNVHTWQFLLSKTANIFMIPDDQVPKMVDTNRTALPQKHLHNRRSARSQIQSSCSYSQSNKAEPIVTSWEPSECYKYGIIRFAGGIPAHNKPHAAQQ